MSDSAAATPVEEVNELNEGDAVEEQPVETMKLHVKLPGSDDVTIEIPVTETANEIRMYLGEQRDSWFFTSFHLEAAGKPIDETIPLKDVSDLKDGSSISVVEEDYDERTARTHVYRVRDIISVSSSHSDTAPSAPSVLSDLSDEKTPFEGFKLDDLPTQVGQEINATPNLTQYYPKPAAAAAKCVHRIALSGFNPPPGNRRLQGDLFYLDVTTLEGETLCVTASSRGFFVNNSKVPNTNGSAAKFDPSNKDAKNSKIHRNLISCLSAASTQFHRLIGDVSARFFERQASIESQIPPFQVYPWLAKPRPHEHDVFRAEDSLKFSHETDLLTGNTGADWNEDLQTLRDMPRTTIDERIARDSQLYRFHTDFVDNVSRGAQLILNGAVSPLNPQDPKRMHMFLYNNLFFFFPTDNQDIFKDFGGDDTAYKNIRNDVLNLAAFKEVDPEGLYTMEMAVVEYRGQRLVGHTLIPGLLTRISKGEEVVVYGSADNKKMADSEVFAKLIREKLAPGLHMAEFTVKDKTENPKEHTSLGSIEIKGIEGNDKRNYIIDFSRLTPRDINYNSSPADIVCVFRPELVSSFFAHKLQGEVIARRKQTPQPKEDDPMPSDEELKKREAEEEAAFEKIFEKMQNDIVFVNDLHTPHDVALSAEKKEAAEKLLTEMATYLKEDTLSFFVADISRGFLNVLDSEQLVQSLHSRGINLRYLGRLAQAVAQERSPFRDVFLREMIVRAAKRVLSTQLAPAREYELASKTAEFLNAFFGRPSNNPKGSRSGLSNNPATADAKASADSSILGELTHSALWSRIRSLVESKYGYQLPEWIPSSIFEYPTLRTLCLRAGIRLESRQYDLSQEKPFDASNIFELVPVVKHRPPQSKDAAALLDSGRQLLDNRLFDKAHDAFATALSVLNQVYGPIHKDVAECHSILSHVLQLFQESETAWMHQQQATAILERVTGTDSMATANAYGNLALITRKVGRPTIALNYIRRAIFIQLLCCGARNLEMWNLFQQYSDTLSEAGKKEEAVDAAKRALILAEPYLGSNPSIMAKLLHSLAIRLSAVHSFREALAYEKRSFSLLKDLLGENDPRTEESNMWLQKLTKMAVQAEVDNKKKQQAAPGAAKPAQPTAASQSSPQALHNLPVAQLVQYINAGSGKRGAVGGRRPATAVTAVRPVAASGSSQASKPAAQPASTAANGTTAPAAQSKKQQKKKAAASKAQ